MKRYLIAIGAAAFVGSTVLASAAALDLTGGVAQTGTIEATCDADGVEVLNRWDPDDVTPVSYGPNVNGIDAACSEAYVMVVARDAGGAELGRSFLSPGHGGGDEKLPAWSTGTIPLSSIDDLTVTVIS